MVLIRRETEAGPVWEERIYRDDQVIQSEALPGFEGQVMEFWDHFDEADEPNHHEGA